MMKGVDDEDMVGQKVAECKCEHTVERSMTVDTVSNGMVEQTNDDNRYNGCASKVNGGGVGLDQRDGVTVDGMPNGMVEMMNGDDRLNGCTGDANDGGVENDLMIARLKLAKQGTIDTYLSTRSNFEERRPLMVGMERKMVE